MNYGEIREQQVTHAKAKRQEAARYLANIASRGAVMERIATGGKVTVIAREIGVPYSALYNVLTTEHKDEYRAARAAFAETLAEKNLDMANKVERLELPHDAAKAASGIRQWHMERMAGDNWGQRSTVDMNMKGVVGLHLEAIRELSKEPIEGDFEEVEDDHVERNDDPDRDSVGDGGADHASLGGGRLKGEELL